MKTLRSVERQRFRDFETIVVIDSGTDDTADRLVDFPWVRVLEASAGGPGGARNVGIFAATGEYIAFLDDDDLWFPWTLDTYADIIRRLDYPAILSATGVGSRIPEDILLSEKRAICYSHKDYLSYMNNPHRPGWILVSSICLRRDFLIEVGGFDASYSSHEDEALWLRLGTAPGYVRVVEPQCCIYREHDSLATNTRIRFENIIRMIGAEEGGEFPGGPERRWERRKVIAGLGRHLARLALQTGFGREGWGLYKRLVAWNIRLGRWLFLIAYPALALRSAQRERALPAGGMGRRQV